MHKRDEPIRQKIIISAISCIEKSGLRGLTVRAIAKEAGVNVAAVNYYFGSKENLLDALMKQTLEHMLMDIREMMTGNPREMLKNIFTYLIGGAILYPNMTRAHLYDAFTANDYRGAFVKRINPLLDELFPLIRPALRVKGEAEGRALVVQMFYTGFFSAIMPDLFKKFWGADLRDPGTLARYIDTLLDAYLA
ncbi:MAG: TetR/AcrR family transcriptional regulator [Spirochaetes bacterium]|nr:MAG: TetR/AcrR family transcriptional regulator [Spirochaetota bacterium]